jgi:outer membrane protein assembly factor BamB
MAENTMQVGHRWFLGLGILASATACGNEPRACQESNGIKVCGDFGRPLFSTPLADGTVAWPPVAIESGRIIVSRGSQLIEVKSNGQARVLSQLAGTATAPSADEQRNLYVLAAGAGGTQVTSLADGQPRWSQPVIGEPAGTPPSIGTDRIYAALAAKLVMLSRTDGHLLDQRDDASAAAVLPDGSIRYLAQRLAGSTYAKLVAETAQGELLWTVEEPAGFSDFAPGPAGETYAVVAGTHRLERVSPAGKVEWTFAPDCADCDVAAAPTVDGETAWFPVWINRQETPIDPLYAIDAKTGQKRWVFDGFDTRSVQFDPSRTLLPSTATDPTVRTAVTHHPAGRPVKATDGTLYVSHDGAVVMLDANGQLHGLAVFDASVGEVTWQSTFVEPVQTWLNPGVRPSPVLAPDGVLYVWDGASVRGFQTGKAAASDTWVAPFGGPSNAGAMR